MFFTLRVVSEILFKFDQRVSAIKRLEMGVYNLVKDRAPQNDWLRFKDILKMYDRWTLTC